MDTKFTPGPWKFWPNRENQSPIICVGNTIEELSGIAQIHGINAEAQANARLIAAAPMLYEACKKLIKNTRDAVDPYNSNRQFYGALPKYFKAIEAALVAAEKGE